MQNLFQCDGRSFEKLYHGRIVTWFNTESVRFQPGDSALRILISGSHGLVGTALIKALEADGHGIYRLVRHAPNSEHEIEWSPDRYSIAISRIEGFDAVYHLAGESIASGRWNDEKKRRDPRKPHEGN